MRVWNQADVLFKVDVLEGAEGACLLSLLLVCVSVYVWAGERVHVHVCICSHHVSGIYVGQAEIQL